MPSRIHSRRFTLPASLSMLLALCLRSPAVAQPLPSTFAGLSLSAKLEHEKRVELGESFDPRPFSWRGGKS